MWWHMLPVFEGVLFDNSVCPLDYHKRSREIVLLTKRIEILGIHRRVIVHNPAHEIWCWRGDQKRIDQRQAALVQIVRFSNAPELAKYIGLDGQIPGRKVHLRWDMLLCIQGFVDNLERLF